MKLQVVQVVNLARRVVEEEVPQSVNREERILLANLVNQVVVPRMMITMIIRKMIVVGKSYIHHTW